MRLYPGEKASQPPSLAAMNVREMMIRTQVTAIHAVVSKLLPCERQARKARISDISKGTKAISG